MQAKKQLGKQWRTVQTWVFRISLIIFFISTPAAAAHDSLPCEVPDSLVPLFDLLHSITEIALLAGIALATLGFVTSGILLMLPGEDSTRRGKQVAKNVLIGTILLLSASMITSFLVSQMGSTICT
jgi:hypothetical protein